MLIRYREHQSDTESIVISAPVIEYQEVLDS